MSDHLIRTTLRELGRSRSRDGPESAEGGGAPSAENAEALYRQALLLATSSSSPDEQDVQDRLLVVSCLNAGREALQQILSEGEKVSLDARQLTGLEAIIRLTGRPSFLVKENRVSGVPKESEWFGALMEGAADSMHRVLRSVGRVNLQDSPAPGYAGTAFMVAPGVLMTNRHVASQFTHEKSAGRWIVVPERAPTVDFLGEYQQPAGPPFPITAVLLMHPSDDVDLALLQVEPTTNAPLPDPLCLSTRETAIKKSKLVYAIGYPAFDGHNDRSEIARIFGGAFGVKRLAPGEILQGTRWFSSNFRHDCTTLGGSSGSCIIDFNTHQVLGLHVGGVYLEANLALSLPKLRTDRGLTKVPQLYG